MLKWLNIIFKTSSLAIQTVLVIAGVLIFCYIDPFSLFNSRKPTLKDTPITVNSVREIGKIITADYYGEVLSSLKETYIEEISQHVNSFVRYDSIFKFRIKQFKDEDIDLKRRKDIAAYFHENYKDLTNDSLYPYYLEYLKAVFKKKKKIPFLTIMTENKVIEELRNSDYWNEPFNKTIFNDIKTKRKFDDYLAPNKRELKKQIVLLGRGWVRAGFNFETFSEHNFQYDSVHNNIYFIGIEPQILYCDINPWFNPEKKIKGFELILYTGKANRPDYLKLVKQDCLDELLSSAIKSGIMEKAKTNAENNFKELFSILLGKPINKVYFLDNKMAVLQNCLYPSNDSIINGAYLPYIDTLLLEINKPNDDSTERTDLIKHLAKKTINYKGINTRLSIFSPLFYKIMGDYTVDSSEISNIIKIKSEIIDPKINNQIFLKWYQIQELPISMINSDFDKFIELLILNSDQVVTRGKSYHSPEKKTSILIKYKFNSN